VPGSRILMRSSCFTKRISTSSTNNDNELLPELGEQAATRARAHHPEVIRPFQIDDVIVCDLPGDVSAL
jgi:hypothetical protein